MVFFQCLLGIYLYHGIMGTLPIITRITISPTREHSKNQAVFFGMTKGFKVMFTFAGIYRKTIGQ